MKTLLNTHIRASAGAFAAAPMYPGAPQIVFGPADDLGGSGGSNAGGDDTGKTDDTKTGEEQNDGKTDDTSKTKTNESGDGTSQDDTGKAEDKGLLREVMEKKNKIRDLESQLARFDGIDPDAVRALLQEKRAAELAAEEAAGNFTRVKEMMVEEHTRSTSTLTQQIADLQAQLQAKDGTINELTVGRSFSESKFIGDDLVLTRSKARQLYANHFEVVDGKIVGYDKPVNAKERTVLTGADGKPMSFEDAIKRIIDADPEKDSLYRDKAKPGAGSSTSKVDTPKSDAGDAGLFGASRILAGLNAGK